MKNIIKAFIALALVLCVSCAFVACGDDDIYKDPSAATGDTGGADAGDGDVEGTEDTGDTDDDNNGGNNGGGVDNKNVAPGNDYAIVHPA